MANVVQSDIVGPQEAEGGFPDCTAATGRPVR